MMTSRRYRILSHTADTGIATRADTLGEVIANAAFAMFDLSYDTSGAAADRTIEFSVQAESPPDLLVEVLAELLYLSETQDLAFFRFGVDADVPRATVRATGVNTALLDLRGPPIKAVTYHDLRCEPIEDHWEARVIFDV